MQRLLPISPGTHRISSDLEWLCEGLHRAGCRQLVLREPHLDERSVIQLAMRVSVRLPELILHARLPGALALATTTGWGLHLPSDADVRALRSGFPHRLGVSCHSAGDALSAQQAGADYVLLSPIWRPTSKPRDRRTCLGTSGLRAATAGLRIPVFALGGVRPDRIEKIRRNGAFGAAVLGGLFSGDPVVEEIEDRARSYLQPLTGQLPLTRPQRGRRAR